LLRVLLICIGSYLY